MRFKALRDFFADLVQGDPVALTIAGVFLALLILPATFWVMDQRNKNKKKPGKNQPKRKSGV